ncbi:MAG: DUF3786 domain-containing protein [Thermodesulfobacteriota bacterium]
MSIRPDEYTMWLERARTGKNVERLEEAYDDLILKVKRIDPLTIQETTDSKYRGDGVPRVVIPFLYSWFVLRLLPYGIRAEHPNLDNLPLKVLVLRHIVAAAQNEGTAVRVMGTWIDIRSLQHGAILGAHFSRSIRDVMDRFFGFGYEERISRVLGWSGKPVDLGDESYLFHFFPRLPVALVHWRGDEEFPPYSKILFDVSASNYMPTHGIAALTEFLIHRLAE